MSNMELKQCPCCGKYDVFVFSEISETVMDGQDRIDEYMFWVRCDYCGLRTEKDINRDDAVDYWNTRTAAQSQSGWVNLEDMPDEWKVDGTPLAVWGWPDYKSADEDGTDATKVVGFGRWDDKYGNVYGVFCNSHFTITHVKKILPPQTSELG